MLRIPLPLKKFAVLALVLLINACSSPPPFKSKPFPDSPLAPIFTLTDQQGQPRSIGDFKGKVIYVDFWASWCGPCRQQFPFSKQMHDGLNDKEKKKVVFLYISIDEDLDAWKNAVQQLKLDNGENGHSIPAAQKYQVNSIPRYMIIDKNGNIVNPNAPRPSDPSALELLKKLMNEV